jgi:hypothetical protein
LQRQITALGHDCTVVAPSLVSLQEAINRYSYLAEHNRDPRPFEWTADPDAIVEKVRRGYHALASMEQRAG